MAEPLRITVGSSTADENPYAAFDAAPYGDQFAQPIQVDPRSRDLVIRTVFGEADGKDEEGRAAVANVIRNRIASGKYGKGAEGVINKPWAFEPWMRPDARGRMLGLREDDPNYQSIAQIVDKVLSGSVKDNTGGATHFFAPRAQAQLGRNAPAWAEGKPVLANIGGHLFYAPDEPSGGSSSPNPASRGGAAARSVAPPTVSPADRNVMTDMVALASNTAPDDNPYAKFTPSASRPTAAPASQGVAPPSPPAQQPPPFEGPMPRDVGYGGAISSGLEQGLTFGFGDELRGAAAVGRDTVGQHVGSMFPSLAPLIGMARMATEAFRSNPNPQTKAVYENTTANARAAYKLAQEQYPGTTLASELAGGIAVPLPGGALAAPGRAIGARIAGGAIQGGVAGGLTGFGSSEADLSGRVAAGALGTILGGGIGGAVGAVAPAVMNTVGHTARGLFTPASRARSVVAEAGEQASHTPRDTRVMPSERTPDTVAADFLGEPGQRLARSASNISPEAGAHLKEFTMDRAREQYPRLVSFIETKIGPIGDNALEKIANTAEQAQVTDPLYRGVMDLYAHNFGSQRLTDLVQNNSVAYEAAQKARQRLQNDAAVDRVGAPGLDSLRFWDQVKREIDPQITAAVRAGDKTTERELTKLKNAIVGDLDDMTNGAYKTARETSAGYFAINRALEDGKKFIGSNAMTAERAAHAMRAMTPEAQDAFRRAGINELMAKLSRKSDTHDIWKGIYNSPDAQKKMRLLFNGNDDLIRQFEAMHHVEGIMERLRNRVTGNSSTVEQLIGASAVVGAPGIGAITSGSVFDPTSGAGQTALSGLALLGHGRANRQVADHVAKLLTSNNPQLIDQVVKAAAGDARVMSIIRQAAERLAIKTAVPQSVRYFGD